MWAYDSVFYQIYTLGFCGCPDKNEGVPGHRLQKVADWIPHIRRIHADAVYFTPVFDSDAHGYDTRDYTRIDGRLGTTANSPPFAAPFTSRGSGWCSTGCSTTWAGASGRSRTC